MRTDCRYVASSPIESFQLIKSKSDRKMLRCQFVSAHFRRASLFFVYLLSTTNLSGHLVFLRLFFQRGTFLPAFLLIFGPIKNPNNFTPNKCKNNPLGFELTASWSLVCSHNHKTRSGLPPHSFVNFVYIYLCNKKCFVY